MVNRLYLPSLSGIRVIAVSMIFFSHYWQFIPERFSLTRRVLMELHVGVVLFFVLSGFLIGYHYFASFKFSWGWFKKFIHKRLTRIYPLFLIVLAVTLTFLNADNFTWFISATLVKGFFEKYKFYGLAPSWVLTVEMTFYLLVPLIFVLWKRIGILRLVAGFWVVGLLLMLIGTHFQLNTFFGSFAFMANYSFFGRSFEFLAGVWVGIAVRTKKMWKFSNLSPTYVGLLIFDAGLLTLCLLQSPHNALGLFHPIGFVVNSFVCGLGAALMLWGLASEITKLSIILGGGIMQVLGKASYAFFLMHYSLVMSWMSQVVGNSIWAAFLGMWLLSICVYYLVEKPVMQMFRI